MKYFLDTKFIEDGKTIDLITIAIVCEDGRELYLGNSECIFYRANNWVKKNVLINLNGLESNLNYLSHNYDSKFWKMKTTIADDIVKFFKGKTEYAGSAKELTSKREVPEETEMWAYYADYDWVVFCQLFGTMMDLPKGFPMYCRDLKQECDRLGNPDLPAQENKHNALDAARWNYRVWKFLRDYEAQQRIQESLRVL